LSPCHGFNGVISQYQGSTHYQVYLANVNSATAAEWTAPGSPCGNCHAIDAIQQRITGNVQTDMGAGVVNLAHGELQYLDPKTKSLAAANYVGTATIAQVYCTTCHAVTNQNDPHKTGIPWSPGSFPLYVDSDGGSIFLEKSPTVGAVTGTNAGSYGPGDTCMWCHRSRNDVTNYIAASNAMSVHWGPHEGPQADVFTATGGYEFPNMSYGTSTHQQKLSCVDCHMPDVAGNSNVPLQPAALDLRYVELPLPGADQLRRLRWRVHHQERADGSRARDERSGMAHAVVRGPVRRAQRSGRRQR
jgi:hypothetical protein